MKEDDKAMVGRGRGKDLLMQRVDMICVLG